MDRLDLHGVRALEARGVLLVDADGLMEEARAVKCPDEITAMRFAVHACEAAVGEMRAAFEPGVTEMALWAVLQAGNFARYGEWLETARCPRGPVPTPGTRRPAAARCGPPISWGSTPTWWRPTGPASTCRAPGCAEGAGPLPGMVMCIEAFVGAKSGGEGVKLEQQVLITEDGNELLTTYPLDLG